MITSGRSLRSFQSAPAPSSSCLPRFVSSRCAAGPAESGSAGGRGGRDRTRGGGGAPPPGRPGAGGRDRGGAGFAQGRWGGAGGLGVGGGGWRGPYCHGPGWL